MVDTCSSGLTGPSLMVCAVKWLVHSRSSRPGREHTVNICWPFQTWVNDIAKADCFFQLPFRKVYMEGILYALAIQRASILAFGSFLELWGDRIFLKKYWEFELNLMRFFFFFLIVIQNNLLTVEVLNKKITYKNLESKNFKIWLSCHLFLGYTSSHPNRH